MSDRLDAALKYLEYGWSVFPLLEGGKAPATPNGFHDASDDPEEVVTWWERADYNIGIPTGELSGVVVADIDQPDVFDYTTLPRTLTARTGGDHRGFHLYMLHPQGGVIKTTKLYSNGQHIGELKASSASGGNGGYVVAPPSYVLDDYKWVDKARPIPFPDDVFQKLQRSAGSETGHITERRLSVPGTHDLDAFAKGVLAKAVGKIRLSDHGEHNTTIHNEAVWVFGLVKAGCLDLDLARDHMYEAAVSTGHAEERVIRTLDSAYRRAESWSPESVRSSGLEVIRTVFKPGATLLEEDDLDRVKPPVELIPEALPEGLNVLFGRHSSGKSTLAVDWALTLTLDGHDVLYCVGEDTVGLAARVRTWKQVHGVLPRSGKMLVGEGDDFPHLNDKQSIERWLSNIETVKPKLVVLDTHGLWIGEEDTSNTKAAVEVYKRIVNGGTSLLVIHHQAEHDGPVYKSRGSGHLDNSCDGVIQATKPPPDRAKWDDHWLTWHKYKNGALPRPVAFKVVQQGGSVVSWPSTPMRQSRI